MTKQSKILCPACHTKNDRQGQVCGKCGLPLDAPEADETRHKIICPRCLHTNNAGSFFCYNCGKYFAETAPVKSGKKPAMSKRLMAKSSTPKASVIMPGGSEITLTGSPVFIERSDFNGATSQELLMTISRQHILISCDRRKYYVKDYGRDGKGSTNHTKLNGIDIHGKTRKSLKDGDKIELAGQPELTLTFKSAGSLK